MYFFPSVCSGDTPTCSVTTLSLASRPFNLYGNVADSQSCTDLAKAGPFVFQCEYLFIKFGHPNFRAPLIR